MSRTKGRNFTPVTNCEVCGKELSSKDSIDRHRGQKCHMEWMERRVTELEQQVLYLKAAVDALIKS